MKKTFQLALLFVPLLPAVAFAQTLIKTNMLLSSAAGIVDLLIWILSAVALLVFIWGIVKYISSAGDADKAKEGKSIMIYGVIALFVLFSVWGLVRFLRSELGVSNDAPVSPPRLNL